MTYSLPEIGERGSTVEQAEDVIDAKALTTQLLASAPDFNLPAQQAGCLPRVLHAFVPKPKPEDLQAAYENQHSNAVDWFAQHSLDLQRYPVATLVEMHRWSAFPLGDIPIQKRLWALSSIWFAILGVLSSEQSDETLTHKHCKDIEFDLKMVQDSPNLSREQQQLLVVLQATHISPELGYDLACVLAKEDGAITFPVEVVENRDYAAVFDAIGQRCHALKDRRLNQPLQSSDQLSGMFRYITNWLSGGVAVFQSYQGSRSSGEFTPESRRRMYVQQVRWLIALEFCATIVQHHDVDGNEWSPQSAFEFQQLVGALSEQLEKLVGYAKQHNIVVQIESIDPLDAFETYACVDDVVLNQTTAMIRFLNSMVPPVDLLVDRVLSNQAVVTEWKQVVRTLHDLNLPADDQEKIRHIKLRNEIISYDKSGRPIRRWMWALIKKYYVIHNGAFQLNRPGGEAMWRARNPIINVEQLLQGICDHINQRPILQDQHGKRYVTIADLAHADDLLWDE